MARRRSRNQNRNARATHGSAVQPDQTYHVSRPHNKAEHGTRGGIGGQQTPRFDNSRGARRSRKFKPFIPPDGPPPGTYDPALAATLRAARRGYGDFQRDTERDTTRRAQDLSLASGIINTDRSQALGDILRNYRNLGRSQTSAGASAGLLDGGFAAASARARQQNRGRETFRTNQGADRRIADLTLQNQRAGDDSTTALDRAGRELGQFKHDTLQSELFQAKQSGWVPPDRPKWQRNIHGHVVRIDDGNVILPNGTILTRQQAMQRFNPAAIPNSQGLGQSTGPGNGIPGTTVAPGQPPAPTFTPLTGQQPRRRLRWSPYAGRSV